jgi:hypothetical protein
MHEVLLETVQNGGLDDVTAYGEEIITGSLVACR